MKKIHDDSIILCSNRTDRKIPPHGGIIANYYTDDKGFTVFELEHTKREFANRNLVLDIGYFLLTEEGCYKVIEITYAEATQENHLQIRNPFLQEHQCCKGHLLRAEDKAQETKSGKNAQPAARLTPCHTLTGVVFYTATDFSAYSRE